MALPIEAKKLTSNDHKKYIDKQLTYPVNSSHAVYRQKSNVIIDPSKQLSKIVKKPKLPLSVLFLALTVSTSLYAQSIDWYGRDLPKHEEIGGHTIEKHVGKSLKQMQTRCKFDPPPEGYVSSFSSLTSAEKLVAAEISRQKTSIIAFMAAMPAKDRIILRSPTPSSTVTGSSLKCGGISILPTNRTRVVIEKDPNNKPAKPAGWFVLTSFPFS